MKIQAYELRKKEIVNDYHRLDSSIGRALHRYRRGYVWVRIPFKPDFFSRLSFRNCLSCVYICNYHSLIHSSNTVGEFRKLFLSV